MKLLILATAAVFAACSNGVSDTAETSPDWIEADYAKPGAPLTLAYQDLKSIDVGDSPEISLRVSDLAPNSVVEIDVTSGSGLEILGSERRFIQADAKGVANFTIDVRAMSEGRHYLNVFAGIGQMGKRIVTVPVSVGHGLPAMKTTGELSTDSQGRAILVMDAEETIDGVPQ